MCVIVSTHFSRNNRTMGKIAEKKTKYQGKSGISQKHDKMKKTTNRERDEGIFSVQMHEVVTAVCTCMHFARNTINFVFIPSFRAPHDRPGLVNVSSVKNFHGFTRRRHYDATYVNTIAGKRRKNERGRHEGEYPAGANEGEKSSDVVFGRSSRGGK